MGVSLDAPDHTTLSRRGRQLAVKLRACVGNESIHLIVDSTGLEIVGQGQWAAVKHGGKGIRGWRKLHLGVDDTGNIVAETLTNSATDDASMVHVLLDQVEGDVERFTADGAYDNSAVYEAVTSRGATVVVPPSKTAVVSEKQTLAARARNATVSRVQAVGRRRWKKESGYHRQAKAENAFFRYKRILGSQLRARDLAGQQVEVRLSCNILSRMTALGAPQSYAIGR